MMALEKLNRRSHDGNDNPCFKAFVKEIELKDKAKRRNNKEQCALKKVIEILQLEIVTLADHAYTAIS